jgi:hypothetical protein
MSHYINSRLDIKLSRDTEIIVDQSSASIPGSSGFYSAINKLVDQLLFVYGQSILLLSSLFLFGLWGGNG